MEVLPFAALHFVKGKCCWGEVVSSVGFSVGYVPVAISKKKNTNRSKEVGLIFLGSNKI